MKKIIIIAVCISLCVSLNFIGSKTSSDGKEADLFYEIVNNTQGTVEESGLKTCFYTEDKGEQVCKEIIKKMGITNKDFVINKKEGLNFCSIDFNNNKIQGYIESRTEEGKNAVIIDLSCNEKQNSLASLKSMVEAAVANREKKLKYFQYIKAKIPSSDLKQSNNQIIDILKKNKAENIDTIPIDHGFSTTAYTKRYEIIRDNNKWIDLNFALCSYASGSYLIIGTPIINITY